MKLDTHGWSRKGKFGPPQRTFTEMAEEFGVSSRQLRALMVHHAGPKTRLNGNGATRNVWCDPQTMRAWWNSLKAKT